jgi:hypothetical protein
VALWVYLSKLDRETPLVSTENAEIDYLLNSVTDPYRGREVISNGPSAEVGSTTPHSPRLKSRNGKQYAAVWNDGGNLVVAERSLPDGRWTTNEINISIDVRGDGHYAAALGIGPTDRIFIAYNNRQSSSIKWRKSTNLEDISSFDTENTSMTGSNESSVSYNQFFEAPNGSLLFGYRDGPSGSGEWHLNKYDGSGWSALHHPWLGGDNDDRGPYPWDLVRDDDGAIRLFWTWRERSANSNTDILCSRSTDNGATWEKSNGTQYSIPIAKGDGEVVDAVDTGNNLKNQGWSAVNPTEGTPHIAYIRDDSDGNTQLFHASLNDKSWTVEVVTNRAVTTDFSTKELTRPAIAVSNDGRVYLLSRDQEYSGYPWLFQRDLDGNWSSMFLKREYLGLSEVMIDADRWRRDKTLSFIKTLAGDGDRSYWESGPIQVVDVNPLGGFKALREAKRQDPEYRRLATIGRTSGSEMSESSTSFTTQPRQIAASINMASPESLYARVTIRGDANAEATVSVVGGYSGRNGNASSTATASPDFDSAVATTGWIKIRDISPDWVGGYTAIDMRPTDGNAASVLPVLELAERDDSDRLYPRLGPWIDVRPRTGRVSELPLPTQPLARLP